MNKLLLIVALIVGAIVLLALTTDDKPADNTMNVNRLMSGEDNKNFTRATHPIPFNFPRDHGPHPDFRNEWWYLTGNITDNSNNRYGYQLTFFRRALFPSKRTDAGWQDANVYMAHFAISDHRTGQFLASEKWGRNGANIAGAQAQPFRVWLDDWQLKSNNENGALFPLTVEARNEQFNLELVLTPAKSIVLQGDKGLSQKSTEAGNASYYYSFSRLLTKGTLSTHDESSQALKTEVKGTSWLDREWSTSALSAKQQGWDWFALQLDNGEDIMLYRLRNTDGTQNQYSGGIVVPTKGEPTRLDHSHFELSPLAYWEYGAQRYPISWQLRILHPRYERDWIINTPIKEQRLDVSIKYWEGAIDVIDTATQKIIGLGFLEMTGY